METFATYLSAENSALNLSQADLACLSGIVKNDPDIPQPSEALLGTHLPPFITKIYDMVDDPKTDGIVSWSSGNNSFVVWNLSELIDSILPNYFKHQNFSTFVRQLNKYGFRKVDPDRCEFAAKGFMRGQRHLLETVRRRKPVNQNQAQLQEGAELSQGSIELGKFGGLEEEIQQLKRDKDVLMHELVKMRQQQQTTDENFKILDHRLAAAEQRQQKIITFLAKIIHKPSIFAHLAQQNDANKLVGSLRGKRQLPKQERLTRKGDAELSSSEGQTAKIDPAKFSFTELLNSSEPASVDATRSLPQELFHVLEQESDGQDDENGISESDSNLNPNETSSAETRHISKGFISPHSSISGSSNLEELAGQAENESLEGPDELQMEFLSNEEHTSIVPIHSILDSNEEYFWNELFERMEGMYSSINAFAKEGTTAGLGNGECTEEPPARK